jgi:hypothetical protein
MEECSTMRRSKIQPIRVKLDMADIRQVRLVKKRLGISERDLVRIVDKIGNSLSAISKEVATQRARQLSAPVQVPDAAIITSVTAPSVSGVTAATVEASGGGSNAELPATGQRR